MEGASINTCIPSTQFWGRLTESPGNSRSAGSGSTIGDPVFGYAWNMARVLFYFPILCVCVLMHMFLFAVACFTKCVLQSYQFQLFLCVFFRFLLKHMFIFFVFSRNGVCKLAERTYSTYDQQ